MKPFIKFIDYSLVVFVILIISARALAATPVYNCRPMYAWDTGYNVAINYDETQNEFQALVSAVDFFGEKPVINEKVQLDLAKGADHKSCIFSFNQTRPSNTHSVALQDYAHQQFVMDLQIENQKVDNSNKVLRCTVEPWFAEQFSDCP